MLSGSLILLLSCSNPISATASIPSYPVTYREPPGVAMNIDVFVFISASYFQHFVEEININPRLQGIGSLYLAASR